MEPGGIEPPSRCSALAASTCIVADLCLGPGTARDGISRCPAWVRFNPPPLRRQGRTSPLVICPQKAAGEPAGDSAALRSEPDRLIKANPSHNFRVVVGSYGFARGLTRPTCTSACHNQSILTGRSRSAPDVKGGGNFACRTSILGASHHRGNRLRPIRVADRR